MSVKSPVLGEKRYDLQIKQLSVNLSRISLAFLKHFMANFWQLIKTCFTDQSNERSFWLLTLISVAKHGLNFSGKIILDLIPVVPLEVTVQYRENLQNHWKLHQLLIISFILMTETVYSGVILIGEIITLSLLGIKEKIQQLSRKNFGALTTDWPIYENCQQKSTAVSPIVTNRALFLRKIILVISTSNWVLEGHTIAS